MFASIFQCPDKQILSIADKNILKRIVFEDVYQIKAHEVYFRKKQKGKAKKILSNNFISIYLKKQKMLKRLRVKDMLRV